MAGISDVYLIETGDGGDAVLLGNNIKTISGFENMIYIGLFGGNPGNPTLGAKQQEQIFDFWGNYMLEPSERRVWFNSNTEYVLENTALTSAGRIEIEQAVLSDLEFMREFAEISVNVQIIEVDKVKITITIFEPSIQNTIEFSYIWNQTQQEIESLPNQSTVGQGIALDNLLNFGL